LNKRHGAELIRREGVFQGNKAPRLPSRARQGSTPQRTGFCLPLMGRAAFFSPRDIAICLPPANWLWSACRRNIGKPNFRPLTSLRGVAVFFASFTPYHGTGFPAPHTAPRVSSFARAALTRAENVIATSGGYCDSALFALHMRALHRRGDKCCHRNPTFLAGRDIGVTPTCSSAVYGAP